MFKNIIFDVDGTLLATKEAGLLALQKTLHEDFQIEQTIDELEFAFSSTATQVFNKFNIPPEKHRQTAKSIMENAFAFTDEIKPFPGIEDVLQKLQQKHINLAIVTSEDREELDAVFMKTSIGAYFDKFVTADQVQNPKPDAEPTNKALSLLNANPEQTLFIGDSRSDIGSAHGANVSFGLASWGANEQDDFSDADYIFKEPQDILSAL